MNPNEKIISIIIDPSKSDIKNNEKQDINEFSIQEIRGWVIDGLNTIDSKLDFIITEYFNPEKKSEFKNIVLNSSVVTSGAKMKIIRNIKSFDNLLISNIQKIISIRNSFAHAPMSTSASFSFINEGGELKSKINDITSQFIIMNSSGETSNKNIKTLIKEFEKLSSDINEKLDLML